VPRRLVGDLCAGCLLLAVRLVGALAAVRFAAVRVVVVVRLAAVARLVVRFGLLLFLAVLLRRVPDTRDRRSPHPKSKRA